MKKRADKGTKHLLIDMTKNTSDKFMLKKIRDFSFSPDEKGKKVINPYYKHNFSERFSFKDPLTKLTKNNLFIGVFVVKK